jgi:DNA-binding FrmR family transcriptional regulator
MNPMAHETRPSIHRSVSNKTLMGAQPIALAAGTLFILLAGISGILLARAYTGTSPEPDRVAVTRQLQVRTAQASEQLMEKTKGLEASQQESIDQLQTVQGQLEAVRRLLSAQQAETKRLSEQVASLTTSVDGLRQSFASAQTSEPATAPAGNRAVRTRARAGRGVHRRHS